MNLIIDIEYKYKNSDRYGNVEGFGIFYYNLACAILITKNFT